MSPPTEWYQNNYLISTNSSLIQPAAVNAALGSDLVYWAKHMDEKLLKKMLDNSLCFGVYELPTTSAELAGRGNPPQIGLARLITDQVSFAYLTDVYILKEHQGQGLGKLLIKCVDEVLSSWPELKRALLITDDEGVKFYGKMLGMKEFEGADYTMMSRKGPGSVFPV